MSTSGEVAVRRFVRYDGRQEILPAMFVSRRTAFFAVLALLGAGAFWFFGGRTWVAAVRTNRAVERLIDASPGKLPAARFSVLRGRVLVQAGSAMRGRNDDVTLKARAAEVLRVSAEAPYAMARSASAAASVMQGDWSIATKELEEAVAEHPAEASLWNDLAAARHEQSVAKEDPLGQLDALVAADRSLRIDPRNSDALFNRALILEGLGLRTVAADAWRAARDADDPSVSMEASRRLSQVAENWAMAQPKFERAAAEGDAAEVERIVHAFPQDVRAWGDVMYLTFWANAFLVGDAAGAAQNLKIARAAGGALRARGEALLADAVAVIDGASGETLRTIAIAQQQYDKGRDAYRDGQYADAERRMTDAANGFGQARSPMRYQARAYVAFSAVDDPSLMEAHPQLTALAAELKAQTGYRAVLAYVLWMDGKDKLLRGRWDESIAALRQSRALFDQLGETKNVGTVEHIMAEVYQRVGRPDLAWPHCVAAWRETSEDGNAYGVMAAVSSSARIAMWTQSWDAAASLIEIELVLIDQLPERMPRMSADARRRLFLVENERKEWASRDNALARARIAAAQAGDISQQQLVEIDQAEALVTMKSDSDRAVTLFTRALHSAASSGQGIFVADLYWNRGRAHLAAGEKDAAKDDFIAGVAELEKQRGAIATPELRARFFDTSEGLFKDTVDLLVQRGDATTAFQYADRSRARALLEINDSAALPAPVVTPAALSERLPDTALVEFAMLDREVVVFCVHNGAVTMQRLAIAPDELRKKIDDLRRRIARGPLDRVRDAGGDLFEILFGAIENRIDTAGTIVIVPGDDLQRVPFSALWRRQRKQYLVQSHAIAIAPSAAVLTTRRAPARTQRAVLLVGNAAGNEEESLEYLPNVKDEIATLQRVYRSANVFLGPEASKSRFVNEVAAYDVVHFAGHGLSDDESLTASLLFARGANDSGRLYTNDIAALRLPRAPLVVLAACGTLRGRVGGVEGMPSLARSFLAAGASTVIGTLWDTDDRSSVSLLTAFHRSVAGNVSPAMALRDAQRDAIARGDEGSHPKNWSQYVVYAATPSTDR
jgi:CHAT domain-containing protein